jgi:hypothetical protein
MPLWRGPNGTLVTALPSVDWAFRAPAGAGADPLDAIDVIDCGVARRFPRLHEERRAAAADAEAILGAYHSGEADADAEIARDGDKLMLGFQGRFGGSIHLLSRAGADLWTAGLADGSLPFRLVLEFDRSADSISGFCLSSARTRRLSFGRRPSSCSA